MTCPGWTVNDMPSTASVGPNRCGGHGPQRNRDLDHLAERARHRRRHRHRQAVDLARPMDDHAVDLATICLNQIQPADPALPAFQLVTSPTPLQRHALDLLGVSHRLGFV